MNTEELELTKKAVELLNDRNLKDLKELLAEQNPADISNIFEEVPRTDVILLFRLLPKELAADTFAHLDSDEQELIIKGFSDKEIEAIMEDLFIDDAVDLIEEMPASVVKRILKNTDRETRNTINDILKYPKDCAGSIMTTEYVNFRPQQTVEEAFSIIRKTGVDKETIYTCYVIEKDRKLLGTVSVKDLLLNDYSCKISDIMDSNIIAVNTLDDKEDVVKKFSKYDLLAIPVVDNEDRLIGIITVDDAMDVMEDETEEDFAIMAAMTPTEDSYFKTSVFSHAKHRILWLLFLMLSATLTGTIITKYENAFTAIPILVSFIPMLIDTGGNCGSQSSTLVIRGLALEEIKFKDIFKVMFKEFRIALVVGIALAIVNGIRIYIMYRNQFTFSTVLLSFTIGFTLMLIVILSELIGCILPMVAQKLKLDPAIMASPLITTIVDTFSVFVFFKVAMLLLPM